MIFPEYAVGGGSRPSEYSHSSGFNEVLLRVTVVRPLLLAVVMFMVGLRFDINVEPQLIPCELDWLLSMGMGQGQVGNDAYVLPYSAM